jgi:hypothetical protein
MAFLKIRLAQRQQENKKSHVYMKGVLLPKLEIEKKVARCYVPLTEQYSREFSAPWQVYALPDQK